MLVLKVSIVDEEAQSTEGHDENWNRNDDDDDDAKNWRNFLYILFFGTCRHDGHEHVLEEIAKLCPPLQQSPISLSYNCFCAYSKEGQRGFLSKQVLRYSGPFSYFCYWKALSKSRIGILAFIFHHLSFTKSCDLTWGRSSLESSNPRGWIETEPGKENNHYAHKTCLFKRL